MKMGMLRNRIQKLQWHSRIRPQVWFGFGLICMPLMLIVPLPVIAIDFLIAISMATAVTIMAVSIFAPKALGLRDFPAVLLTASLFRLCLRGATTRTILLYSQSDPELPSLMRAFGRLVMGTNFAIGAAILFIVTVTNLLVITKGWGRLADAAVRFAVDAMPGRQMAVDTELLSNRIDEKEARQRRKTLEDEASLLGSWSTASRFMSSDIIAGILITLVNSALGLFMGRVQYGMSLAESASRFVSLAVTEGLISSLPVLMFSVATGLIATGFTGGRSPPEKLGKSESAEKNLNENENDLITPVDALSLEVGASLVKLIDTPSDGELIGRIRSERERFAQELGILVPQVTLKANLDLPSDQYVIYLRGCKVATGKIMVDCFLALDRGNVIDPIEGQSTLDPAYEKPALWTSASLKEIAQHRGYQVHSGAVVMVVHLSKVIREHAAEMLTRKDVQNLTDRIRKSHPTVVDEVVHPERLSVGDVLKVLRGLLREEVSVRDVLSIFECLADNCRTVQNPELLVEMCRKNLGRSIVARFQNSDGELLVVSFDRTIEDLLQGAVVVANDGGAYLCLGADVAKDIIMRLLTGIQRFESEETDPVLMVSSRIRAPFSKLVSRWIPQVAVISVDEIPLDVRVRNLQMIV